MAAQVDVWDSEKFEHGKSEREYEQYEMTAIQVSQDRWIDDRGVALRLYVDTQTGIVTTDVGLYEKSLK